MNLNTIQRLVFSVSLPVALLCISAVAFAGDASTLIDLSKVDASKLTTTHATVEVIGANPAIPSAKKWLGSSGWNNCAAGWDERGARLQGRPFFNQHANYGPVHVDVEYLEDSPSTVAARAWLRDMIDKPKQ